MTEQPTIDRNTLLTLTTQIVSAHVENNTVEAAALSDLIQTVFAKLSELATGETQPTADLTPAVPIKKSVTDDYIVCLEDGRKLKMLKGHLRTDHGMTPEAYRAKWGLKADYPMVAASYAQNRREMAIRNGLGRKAKVVAEVEPVAKATARGKAGKSKKAKAA